MRAATIVSSIIAGGILGFIIGSKSYNPQKPLEIINPKPVKASRRTKKTPGAYKPRKKKIIKREKTEENKIK